jgi:hypothetical protein
MGSSLLPTKPVLHPAVESGWSTSPGYSARVALHSDYRLETLAGPEKRHSSAAQGWSAIPACPD